MRGTDFGAILRLELLDRLLQRHHAGMLVRVLQQELSELSLVFCDLAVVGPDRGIPAREQAESGLLAFELLQQLAAALGSQAILRLQIVDGLRRQLHLRVIVARLSGHESGVLLLEVGEAVLGIAQPLVVFGDLRLDELLRRVRIGLLDAEGVLDKGFQQHPHDALCHDRIGVGIADGIGIARAAAIQGDLARQARNQPIEFL